VEYCQTECSADSITVVRTTSGDIESILQGCVDGRGIIWWAKLRTQNWGYLIFIAGNRHYNDCDPSDQSGFPRTAETMDGGWVVAPLSSTQVRKDIFQGFWDDLPVSVINSDLLSIYVGTDSPLVQPDDWKDEATQATEVVDDFAMRLMAKELLST
jgi:hypothetical protein